MTRHKDKIENVLRDFLGGMSRINCKVIAIELNEATFDRVMYSMGYDYADFVMYNTPMGSVEIRRVK